MKRFTKEVEAIRKAMSAGEDFNTPMVKLTEKHGTKAIAPLLLMMEYSEDMTHEMYATIHAVESFSKDEYLSELVAAAAEMENRSPQFLRFLLARIMNSDEYFDGFLAKALRAESATRKALTKALTDVEKQFEKKEFIRSHAKSALARLSKEK